MKGNPKDNLTPMFRQYFEIKSQYPDCLLFFHLGDFFELFFEDVEVVSLLLGLVLTKREAGKDLTAPMCGVPVEKSEGYIKKLLEYGFKVAICEQVEDSSQAKGLVKREVVRVYTPGLFIDLDFLQEREKNYLASIALSNKKAGLALLELSCEEFLYTELPLDKLLTELLKREPKEILLEESLKEVDLVQNIKRSLPKTTLAFLSKQAFTKYQEVFTNISESEEVKASLSGIIYYLKLYQPSLAERLEEPKFYFPEEYLFLDENTKRNLELIRNLWDGTEKYSLYWILDKTKTPMGARLLKEWILYPLKDLAEIRKRQRAIEFFLEKREYRERLSQLLKGVSDLERLGSRLSLRIITPKEMALLREGLKSLPPIKNLLEEFLPFLDYPEKLREIYQELGDSEKLREELEKALVEKPPSTLKEGGIFKKGYHPELDELKEIKENTLLYLSKLEQELRRKTGIPTLKIGYNRVFGYYVEVSKSYVKVIPKDFERKQTLAHAERYVVPELKNLEEKILSAEERIKKLEYHYFLELRDRLAEKASLVKNSAKALAILDVLIALTEVAEKYKYTCPEFVEERLLYIEEGRHPVLEVLQGEEKFIPNSLEMKEGESSLIIITGPNMGGKSTFLRQTALIVLLAQMGSFVPAERVRLSLFDRIFTRIGAGDELIRGKSTFMVEMSECAHILKQSNRYSLVLMDEIGRGTSTFDGMALAWAIAEYLYKKGVFTLLATHYYELTDLVKFYPGIKNFHTEVRKWKEEIIFLYKIVPGPANQSYGIEVAKLAHLPSEVLQRAKEVLQQLENKKTQPREKQLSLFSRDAKFLILDKIKKIDPDTITPKEALEFLYQLKRELEES